MARSPLTLAAAACAAVPGVEIVEATRLTTHGEGRNDSAVVTAADGKRYTVRLPQDESTDAELAAEALALRALSDGVRALLNFEVPEFLGAAPLAPSRVFVTTFIPGYQVDAEHLPAGPGVAVSLGETLAAIHSLPATVVRAAGLPARSASEVRSDARRVMDESAATGRVPVRLMVRWRDVIDDDAVWQFEPTVTLGGATARSFVYADRAGVPVVNGVIDWHGLQVSDPAVDMQFLGSAPDAIDHIYAAYATAGHRAPDDLIRTRARLHSELEFAKWLLHGRDAHRADIMDDAAGLLDELAEGVRDDVLRPANVGADLAGAMAALDSVPAQAASAAADTSMHTDTYDPDELMFEDETEAARRLSTELDTQALDGSFFTADPNATQALDPGFFAAEDEVARAHAHEHTGTVAFETNASDAGEIDPNATQPIDPGFFAEEMSLLDRADVVDADAHASAAEADIAEAEQAAEDTFRRWARED